MTRRASLLGKLLGSVGIGRRKVADDALLLDKPLDRDQRYNDITPLLAKFQIGQVVRHRHFPFRGIIFDVDPVFANTLKRPALLSFVRRERAHTLRRLCLGTEPGD